MRAKGYTFIEIIIALAVAVIITSIGVARYNIYIQQQTFVSSAETLVGCLQEGQQDAATGVVLSDSTPARYVMVTIETVPTGLSCTTEGFDSNSTITSMLTESNPSSNILASSLAPNITFNSNQVEFRIIFGRLERGEPLDYTIDGLVSALHGAYTSQGFPSSFPLMDTEGNGFSTTVNIATTGNPITLSAINSQ